MKYPSIVLIILTLSACDRPPPAEPMKEQVEVLKKAEQVNNIVQDAAQQQRGDANQE